MQAGRLLSLPRTGARRCTQTRPQPSSGEAAAEAHLAARRKEPALAGEGRGAPHHPPRGVLLGRHRGSCGGSQEGSDAPGLPPQRPTSDRSTWVGRKEIQRAPKTPLVPLQGAAAGKIRRGSAEETTAAGTQTEPQHRRRSAAAPEKKRARLHRPFARRGAAHSIYRSLPRVTRSRPPR